MLAWGHALLFFSVAMVHHSHAAMTMQAFRQAKLMMEGVCQPRSGVSKELLTQLRNGDFPDTNDRKFKCYFECILRMGRIMEGNKVSTGSLERLARTMLPSELQPLAIPSLESCQDIEGKEGDACDNAYIFVKCHHQNSGAEGFLF